MKTVDISSTNSSRTLFRNFNYKSDVEYVVKVAKILLTPVGVWPLYSTDSTFDKMKYVFQTSFMFSLMCFLLVPHIIYTFFDAEDLTRYMKVIAAQVFSLLGIIKFWTMIINRDDIKYCLRQIETQYKNVESENDRSVMMRHAKLGRQFTIIYLGLLYGGALPYHIIMPFLAERIVKEDNTTQLPLPYLSDYVFFAVENSPFYEILFVTQILFSTIILSTNCGVYSLIASCVMHACCLFEISHRYMETFLIDETDDLRKRFAKIIIHHTRALRFTEMIEKSFNFVFLSEMIGCTIIICFLEYGVLKEWEDNQLLGTIIYFILVISILVNVFTISSIGDRLKEESVKIGEVSYFINWYALPAKKVNGLVMVMMKSNRPSALTAGKIFDVSLQGFCDVCKTSAAYLNFIRMIAEFMEESNLMQKDKRLLDFHYAAQVSFWLLKPIGAWPLEQRATKRDIIIYILTIIFATFFQLFMIVPWIVRIVTAKWSMYEILRTACPLIFSVTVFLRYLLLLFHRDEIRSCIDRIIKDWLNAAIIEDRKIMLANAKSGRFFGMISVAFMFGSGLPYTCMPLMLPPVVTEDNVTIRSLPNPSELIFWDVQVTPVYEVVYALETVSCCVLYTVFCGICSLTAKFTTHACGQCEILMCILKEIIDGGDRNTGTVDQRIRNVITHHLRILKFVSDVDKILNEICLAEFINASCNVCLLGYYVIMDWNNQEAMLQIVVYFVAFVSLTFNIYIFCYIGEQLVDRYQKIGIKCYMIEWYRLPHNKARNLIFLMIMSNYPIELTAGKMMAININSFSNILKTSMAYINLLREVISRDNI
ncbi:uncharacterized protein [Polyergus mexicanus]|uniref:uncharacterized protein n=1 Tax=Polyergus mexicanus TaxID=615972 RepID=UPI0038B54B45